MKGDDQSVVAEPTDQPSIGAVDVAKIDFLGAMVPLADHHYDEHLGELRREGEMR